MLWQKGLKKPNNNPSGELRHTCKGHCEIISVGDVSILQRHLADGGSFNSPLAPKVAVPPQASTAPNYDKGFFTFFTETNHETLFKAYRKHRNLKKKGW